MKRKAVNIKIISSQYKIMGIFRKLYVNFLKSYIHLPKYSKKTEMIKYRVYDYQFYISNEMRDSIERQRNLPAICAFERFKFNEYGPIKDGVEIKNPE